MSEARDTSWPASVGLIGAGAMGRAMLEGLVRGRPGLGAAAVVADAIPGAAQAGAAAVGGRVGDIGEAAAGDVLVLAVKPKDAGDVLARLEGVLAPGTVLLSVVAGWDLPRYRAALPGGTPVVRTMPNLAVRAGRGLVAVAHDGLPDDRHADLARLLDPLGTVVDLPESLFPAATALAGSGPGLLALIAEGMEDGGVAAGLTRDQARAMVRGAMASTVALLSGDDGDPGMLRQRVSSPAGTTIAGLSVLERGAVRAHLIDAVVAAARRAAEL